MIQNGFKENTQFQNDGTGDFSTSERVFNTTETHSKAVVNRTINDISHDSSFRIKVADFQQALKLKNTGDRLSRNKLNFAKQKVKRDRAPSRVNVKKMMNAMKSRILRTKVKATVRKITPRSSLFYYLTTNYTWWRLEYHIRSDRFFTKYLFRGLNKMVHYRPIANNCGCLRRACLCFKGAVKQKQSSKFIYFWSSKSTCSNEIVLEKFSMVERRLLLSGDVELNPGPLPNENSPLLLLRLNQLGLRPLDVGGEGDCFFRAVSHQLYGVLDYHLSIRAAGVQYLVDHPERFVESNTNRSWIGYLNNI